MNVGVQNMSEIIINTLIILYSCNNKLNDNISDEFLLELELLGLVGRQPNDMYYIFIFHIHI